MNVQELTPIVADLRDEFLREDLSNVITRREESKVDLDSNLAQVVIGVRRCGKSTLCRKVLRIAKGVAAYVNFDDERLENMQREDLNNLLQALYIVYGDFRYLLLDEIQNVDGWPLFVNRLLRQGIKLLVTGSNAKLLSNELSTHLTGRHHKIELYPFSFREYAQIKKLDTSALSTKGTALLQKALTEYLSNGGFPDIIKERDSRDYINGLFDAIVKRDVAKRFNVRNQEALLRLARLLIDNFGQEYSAARLESILGISARTIDAYRGYLQEAFLLLPVKKFSFKSKERIRGEKLYLIDNAFISNLPDSFSPLNLGWRLENAVCIELKHRAAEAYSGVFYYRDRSCEIDFIEVAGGRVVHLYQVCFDMSSDKTRNREIRALIYGAQKFNCENLTIITAGESSCVTIGNHSINVVPATVWLTTPPNSEAASQ